MKTLDKSIPLRPRFYHESPLSPEALTANTQRLKEEMGKMYDIKISDTHVWLQLPQSKRKYYSPHLHLEFEANEDNTTHIRGLFGPDPTLWTFFMFLHFAIAGIFIFFAAMAYSHHRLGQNFTWDIIVMAIMLIMWVLLYFFARFNRSRGVPQMYELRELVDRIVALEKQP
ncbi:MAG: hypothetical protein Q4G08_01960 [Capnocytophaga sp.]|nr:hypothetical protein [Capnocytophaga sp.]